MIVVYAEWIAAKEGVNTLPSNLALEDDILDHIGLWKKVMLSLRIIEIFLESKPFVACIR